MTDIPAPDTIALVHLGLPRLTGPLRGLGTSILAMPRSIGRAFAMAYVDPYAGTNRREKVADDESDGRDPSW